MRRRFRFAWMLKWTGTLAGLFVLTAFFGSAWYLVRIDYPESYIRIYAGQIAVIYADQNAFSFSSMPEFEVTSRPFRLSWGGLTWNRRFNYLGVPLWVPAFVILAPTLALWRLDHRSVPPGHCRKCRYDLTGNESGVCPECGAAFGHAAR